MGFLERHRSAIIIGTTAVVVAVSVGAVVTKLIITGHQHHDTATPETTSTSTTPTLPPFAAPEVPAVPAVPALPPFTPSADLGANCQYPASPEPASESVSPPKSGKVSTEPATISVRMVTNQGDVGLKLANNESPCTVNSFVSLVKQKYFNDTKCHRLTTAPGLSVLQCGDPAGNGTGGPGYEFANEYPTDQYPPGDPALKRPVVYPRGTLAMANAGPNTNGSQFFLVYKDSELPPQYTVFGTIDADGLATLDKIAKDGVAGGGSDGAPATTVTITSARLG